MESKSPFLSKTIWWNLLIAGSAFFPSVSDWFSANPQSSVVVFTVVNLVLRAVTKSKLELL